MTDGSYVAVGYYSYKTLTIGEFELGNKDANGGLDGLVVKYDSNGNVLYANNIGGLNRDRIYSVTATSDGGYAIAGEFSTSIQLGAVELTSAYDESIGIKTDAMIIKFDSSNQAEWASKVGGYREDVFHNIIQTSTGGYVAVGYYYSDDLTAGSFNLQNDDSADGLIIWFDQLGNVLNADKTSGDGKYLLEDVMETSDGKYITVGSGVQIIKYDENWNIEWQKDDLGNDVTAVIETVDGDYLTVGDEAARVYNQDGELQTEGATLEFFQDIIRLNNGEYIATGYREGYKNGAFIAKDFREIDVPVVNAILIPKEIEDTYQTVIPTDDGGRVEALNFNETFNKDGYVYHKQGRFDVAVTKYDINDSIEWSIWITSGGYDVHRGIVENGDGSYTLNLQLENNRLYIDGQLVPGYDNSKALKITPIYGAADMTELEVTNELKEYKITTDVKEIDGVKGGAISGEDFNPYETVKHGHDNEEEIVMTPNENYEIIGITVNGEDYPYTPAADGSFTMPTFTNVTEDIHVVVTYSLRDNKITLTKVDKTTGETLTGATFKLDQIDEREEPQNVIGALTDNGEEYLDGDNTVTFNFIEVDGSYESTNQGKPSSTSSSYIPIDLTGLTGKYNITVNAEISSQLNNDMGSVTLTESTDRPTTNENRFINISGTGNSAADHTIEVDGGKTYYLHLKYAKNDSTDRGDDKFIIHSVQVTRSSSELYHTEVSTNSEGNAITQIPFGKYSVTEIVAPEGYHINDSIPDIEFRGTAGAVHEFTIEDEKKVYVVVHHYIKNTTEKVADDETIEGHIGEDYLTNPKLDLAKYTLEQDVNGDYILPENRTGQFTAETQEVIYYYVPQQIPLTVHHYIDGTVTNVPLRNGDPAEDVVSWGDEHQAYTTEPISVADLSEDYYLSSTPENYAGTYEYDEVIVTYYYKRVSTVITHYYIEGTTDKVPSKTSGEVVEDVKQIGTIGDPYTTTASDDVQEGYDLVGEPVNSTGEFTDGVIEVIYYYRLREYDIITRVDGTGGHISGENDDPYETVGHGNDSVKEIKAVPDDGYKVKDITVNGTPITFTENEEDGTVTLDQFINVTEDKVVIVEFEKLPGLVIVHHYLEGTVERLAPDERIVKPEGEDYTTSKSDEVPSNYTCINETPLNYQGIIGEDPIVVTYYYRLNEETITNEIQKTAHGDVTDNGVEIITKEEGKVQYTISYAINVENYIGKVTYTIVDQLPLTINTTKSNLNGGLYDANTKTITWEETIEGINTYVNGAYSTTITKNIEVVYNITDVLGSISNTVTGTAKTYYPDNYPEHGGEEKTTVTDDDSEIVEQHYLTEKEVQKVWDDNENAKGKRPESVVIQLTANGQETYEGENLPSIELSAANNWKHTFRNLDKYDRLGNTINYSAVEKEVNEGDLKYYEEAQISGDNIIIITNEIKQNIIDMDSKITKDGTKETEKPETGIDYTITYTNKITSYTGRAEITIVDNLPYKIDATKSNLDGGVYDDNKKTITWTQIIEVNGNQNTEGGEQTGGEQTQTPANAEYDIEIVKNIKVVYINIDMKSDRIINHVKGKIELLDTDEKNEVEDTFETKLTPKGKTIAKYVDEEGNELADPEESVGYIGEKYETEEKDIKYYKLIEQPENKTGEYTEEDQVVIYVYRPMLFNIGIDKIVKAITINGESKKISNNKLAKVDIPKNNAENANVKITYAIIVRNTEEIAGKAEVVEYIPAGFKPTEATLTTWTKADTQTLTRTVELDAGETKELDVELEWENDVEKLGTLTNKVSLDKLSNPANYSEVTKDDNQSEAGVIISIKTGIDWKLRMSIAFIGVITILGTAIITEKK